MNCIVVWSFVENGHKQDYFGSYLFVSFAQKEKTRAGKKDEKTKNGLGAGLDTSSERKRLLRKTNERIAELGFGILQNVCTGTTSRFRCLAWKSDAFNPPFTQQHNNVTIPQHAATCCWSCCGAVHTRLFVAEMLCCERICCSCIRAIRRLLKTAIRICGIWPQNRNPHTQKPPDGIKSNFTNFGAWALVHFSLTPAEVVVFRRNQIELQIRDSSHPYAIGFCRYLIKSSKLRNFFYSAYKYIFVKIESISTEVNGIFPLFFSIFTSK